MSRAHAPPAARIFRVVAAPHPMRHFITLPIILLGSVLVLAASGPPAEGTQASIAARADTLTYEVTAGSALVVSLPGPEDATFRGVRLPALAWLVDRSFAWNTLPGERGREYVVVQRRIGTRADTLVLVVDLL